jgi:hypothetical protein
MARPTGSEPNYPSATYERPGPSALPPVTPGNPADRARERTLRAIVAEARARQKAG